MVVSGVAEFSRVCAYDRPGTIATLGDEVLLSRSDPIAQPRTAPDVVAELHALLKAGPYVLAALSLDGLVARLYAITFPEEVVGLVLVDADSERLETLPPPERWEALVRLNQSFGTDSVVPIPGYGDLETICYGADNAVMREAAASWPPLARSLAVLAHGRPFTLPHDAEGFSSGELEAVLRAANEDLATLVPNARFFVAHGGNHDIHQEQPELGIDAIHQVIEEVRDPNSWTASAATPLA
jgi:pimeloyl-ACP methyl ester carboxylesterase